LETWTQGYKFERTGLEEGWIREQVVSNCRCVGDFLRLMMERIAEDQGVERWADCTPTHALYLERIVKDFPEARVLHMIRDGRDVALSMERQGWVRRLPWDPARSVVASALYWEWICRRGRAYGETIRQRYKEIRFEDLVQRPSSVLEEVGRFIQHPLDWDQIQQAAVGSVQKPNTSFDEESFDPVERWRRSSTSVRTAIEAHIGPLLRELGYPTPEFDGIPVVAGLRRRVYRVLFDVKHSLKSTALLGGVFVNARNLSRGSPE
jgi:hypothetical protein